MGTGGQQLSEAAGGCGCMDGGGPSSTQAPCLLLVLPSDTSSSHLLRDWETVGRSHGGRHRVDWVGLVTERMTGHLGVCVPCMRVAISLVRRAQDPHSWGRVCDDGGGQADCGAVTKLVARNWVQDRNSCGGGLINAGGKRSRDGWIGVWLICLVFTASQVRSALIRPGIWWWWRRQAVWWQTGLWIKKVFLIDWMQGYF